MKTHPPIQIRAGDLKPALVGLGKVVAARSSNEALRCVRVEAVNPTTLRFAASDGDLHLDLTVPAQVEGKTSPFLIPLTELRERTTGYKANDTVALAPPAKSVALDKFPEPDPFRATPMPLPDRISTSLLRALRCSSQDETRHILRGACLDVSGKGKQAHRIVGTDGRQLFSSNSMQFPNLKQSVILPDHKLWQWRLLAESRDWTLRIGAEKNGSTPFRIEGPFWQLAGRCLEGNYPNYRQVIPSPESFKTKVTMSDTVAEAIMELIPKLPGRKSLNKPVGLHIEKGLLSLLARETTKDPWQFHPIGKVEQTGPDLVTAGNRDYIQRAVEFGLRTLSLVDEASPIQFSHGGDLMIVMPVRAGDLDKARRPRKVTPLVDGVNRVEGRAKPVPTKRTTRRRASPQPPPTKTAAHPDAIGEVESRIRKANKALATVTRQLDSANGSLAEVRQQRDQVEKELSGFRSVLRSIRNLATGSN